MILLTVTLATVLAVIAVIYFDARPAVPMPSAAAHTEVARPAPDDSRLAMQLAALQKEVESLKQSARSSQAGLAASVQSPVQTDSVEAERALEAERHRTYMAGVAQSFSEERVDFSWAGHASSRVAAAIEEDSVLRGAAHELECREQTCRLQIADDGSGKVSQRLSMMSLRLMDVLPTAAAELLDQGNGHNALVLYMSSQPSVAPPNPAK